MRNNWLLALLTVAISMTSVMAQSTDVSIPDVTGMTAPQAAAALNAVGLRLGSETNIQAEAGQTEGAILSQTPLAGERAAAGSAVDITIARAPNIRLIYDDNDLTLINLSTQPFALPPLALNAVQGGTGVLRGERWGAEVSAGDCVQVWAIGRGKPKSVTGCDSVKAWFTTNNTDLHVWTRAAGVRRFTVTLNGQVQAECAAAPRNSQDAPTTCEFYIEVPSAVPNLPYIYIAYTTDAFVVVNHADDGWLRMNVEVISSSGELVRFSEVTLYDTVDPLLVVGNASGTGTLRQLAPGQCVRLRAPGISEDTFPQPCVPYADGIADQPFWTTDFSVRDREGKERVCKGATPGRLTICVMPR